MLSDPSKFSGAREPCSLWQIFSLKVAKIPVNSDSVELYGYIAARDQVDPLLNYVVNISRDDPVIVVQVHNLYLSIVVSNYSICFTL